MFANDQLKAMHIFEATLSSGFGERFVLPSDCLFRVILSILLNVLVDRRRSIELLTLQ